MKDLTHGSIAGHVLRMAAPTVILTLAQMVYELIDVYFVAKISVTAAAGVNAAANVGFLTAALNQVLGVSTMTLVAHAMGRKDQADARVMLHQCLTLAAVCGVAVMMLLSLLVRPYMRWVAADAATADAGVTFISWVLPGYALTFPMTVMSSALRASGVVAPAVVFGMFSVAINVLLAPILIAGWGTGVALGIKGAGLTTCVTIVITFSLLLAYCHREHRWMALEWELVRPQLTKWWRVLKVGVPAGFDFVLYFVYVAIVYYLIRGFGAEAQAGFGIGSRVMTTLVLPAIAITYSAGPIAAQNFGAGNRGRVKETFVTTAIIGSAAMAIILVVVQCQPEALVTWFDADPSALAVAAVFLQVTSWAFVALGLVSTCSSMFQGLGNTLPSLISSGARLVTFAVPAIWLCWQPWFRIEHVWYLSVVTLVLQAAVSLWLARMEFRRRLPPISLIAAARTASM